MSAGYYTVAELAIHGHVSEEKVRQAIKSGDIPAMQIGGCGPYRIPRVWVRKQDDRCIQAGGNVTVVAELEG